MKNKKDSLAKEFNISSEYCEDMLKDFELISKSLIIKDVKSLKALYKKRIDEKISSKNQTIKNSAGTLIYLSGHAKELERLLNKKELTDARNLLNSKMQKDNYVYGCTEPYIPTLRELEKEKDARLETFNKADSSLSDVDADIMEARMRMYYL